MGLVHFIYSLKFNQSVTFDYKSKLIQYIVADELYEVTNKNAGIADKEYFEKREYDEEFYKLWRKLQKEKLLKYSLEEIENSDLFKYSPFKELNDDQRESVDSIVAALKENENQMIFEKVLKQAENFKKYSGNLVSEKATIYQMSQNSNLSMVAESSTAYGVKND